jgi:hypothetical protein
MTITSTPQDIIIKKGRRRARLVIPKNNHQDVWVWIDSKSVSPKQIFRGTASEANEFFKGWERA